MEYLLVVPMEKWTAVIMEVQMDFQSVVSGSAGRGGGGRGPRASVGARGRH